MERRKRESGSEASGELNRQIERLQRDLNRRERELDEERRETERTMDRMRVLEKDKIELKRELDEVRDEVSEYQRVVDELQQEQVKKSRDQQKTEEEDGRMKSLQATLQERNREIGQFIYDLERLEEDKEELKMKLKEVSDSLAEATTQLSEMAEDRIDLKKKLNKSEDRVHRLEEEKTVLEIRERELLAFKERHDQHLENLGNAVDIRVDVWKKMMFQKDEEIERLNAKVVALVKQIPNSQVEPEKGSHHLKMKVKEREDKIRLLTQQLQEATDEINNNNKVIEELQAQVPLHGGSGEDFDRILSNYEKKVRKLESKVEKRGHALGVVEKEAEEKTREIVLLSARLREYETGQYGLSDAVAEIKNLKNQLRIRDRELQTLTQEINQYQIEGSDLVEENEMLRKSLGHSVHEDLSQDRKLFSKKREEEVEALKRKVEFLENDTVTLKTRNYELKKLLSTTEPPSKGLHHIHQQTQEIYESPDEIRHSVYSQGVGYSVDPTQDHWKEKYDIILHENTELRKGLQEILDSFQRLSDDEAYNVKIESPILENLLREMSARGLINYPYAISSFHLKVCNLEGKNSQLREELHRTRIWAEGLMEKEKRRTDEWREKALVAQDMLKRTDGGKDESLKESQLEVGRWRRIAEQSEKLVAMLNEKVEEGDIKIVELEARLENIQSQPSNTLQHTHTHPTLVPISVVDTASVEVQTEAIIESTQEIVEFGVVLQERLRELENLLVAKDEVIENLQALKPSYDIKPIRSRSESPFPISELQESFQLAHENIQSLTERLRTKDDNLSTYKRLLAEVRGEMQQATERHVQDMNALQSTIHQQQQAFTRMKSTLSHPVRDTQTSDIEGIIKEQLTRINELEEGIRDLEHTMGNVASQLAAARSDAHRWRSTAENRLKEIDLLRERLENPIEVDNLREKIKIQEDKIGEMKFQSHTVSILKEMLDEKEREIGALRSAGVQTTVLSPKGSVENPVEQGREIERLSKTNEELHSKLSKLQLRLSKMNATNRASGMSVEMEELRREYDAVIEQRNALRAQIHQLEQRTLEEDEKKRKTVDGFARWEESKKWKKIVERLEHQKRESEEEKMKLTKSIETLRNLVSRLERDKGILESRHKKSLKSSTSEQSLSDEGPMIGQLRQQIEELRGLLDQKELSGNEQLERLKMETRILRERIHTQERQLTAYQVTNKGDPKVVTEIEKLVQCGDRREQELVKMEQENLDLKLQIQEMKQETPRLRDRVQHLQKLVEVLRLDKSASSRGSSAKSLGELERTITALKSVIEKLQKEKIRPGVGGSKSSQNLRQRQEGILAEKQRLMDQIHQLELERAKAQRLHEDLEGRISELQRQRDDAQSRAQSAEMKLKTFLEGDGNQGSSARLKVLEEEVGRKDRLLTEAKQALQKTIQAKKPKRN